MKKATLFIDESGKSSLIKKTGDPFILTGVILNEEEIIPVEGFFNFIKRKYSIDINSPFHSYDILENPSTKLLTDIEAKSLIESLAEFISLIPVNINIISTDKAIFKRALGARSDNEFKGHAKRIEMTEYPYRIMSAMLFKWFAAYLEQNDGIGEIIVDAKRGGDTELIKTLYACKDPTSGIFSTSVSNQIKERCTAICFAEKKYLSGGVEITDLISYTSFFHARRLISSMNHIGLNVAWTQIKNKLEGRRLDKLTIPEIRTYFGVDADGVHKNLK